MDYNGNLAVAQEPPKVYWLYFKCRGDGVELSNAGLPAPHFYTRQSEEFYSIAYKLDGYFHTKKSKEFLNDMIARLCLTLPIERRYHITPNEPANNRAYKLKEFQNCESLRGYRYERREIRGNIPYDPVFYSLKAEAERRIKTYRILDLEAFTDYAFNVFEVGTEVKDSSTLRAKCRRICEYYEARHYKIDKKKKTFKKSRRKGDASTMEMIEQRNKANEIKTARAKAKFLGAIEVLKIKGVKLTAKAISAESGVSINTCGKYFKAYKEAQNASNVD